MPLYIKKVFFEVQPRGIALKERGAVPLNSTMVFSNVDLTFEVGYWCVAFVLLNAAIYIVSPFLFSTWKELDSKKMEKVSQTYYN